MEASYNRTQDVLDIKLLQPIVNNAALQLAKGPQHEQQHMPVYYNLVQDLQAEAVAAAAASDMPLAFAQARPSPEGRHWEDKTRNNHNKSNSSTALTRCCPPVSYNLREFTMLRLYDVSPSLVVRVLEGMDSSYEEFPFRLSAQERALVDVEPAPPAPLLVVGRSGTGKTTCVVLRLFRQWLEGKEAAQLNPDIANPVRQVRMCESVHFPACLALCREQPKCNPLPMLTFLHLSLL
jgi:hypothetical protein